MELEYRDDLMKVIEVSPTFPPSIGGVETHVHLLTKALKAKGYDIEVFATSPNARRIAVDQVDGLKVSRFPSIAPFDTIFYSRQMTKALQEADVDLVHAHSFRSLPMLSAALARRRNKFKFVVTTHLGFSKLGRAPYLLYNPVFGRMIFNRAERILLVSRQEPEALPILKQYMGKVEMIPNGIEVGDETLEEICDLKPERELRLLYVGRLEKKKGVDTAIEVLKRISDENVTLDVVGVGEYSESLRNLVRAVKLEERVRFHGRIDIEALVDLYRRSHILLLLSEYESFPMVIVEAMNAGVVPIATRVGDVPYEIGEKAGFVVDYPVDMDKVAGIIQELHQDRDRLRQTAEAGWNRVRELFDMKVIAERIGAVYEGL